MVNRITDSDIVEFGGINGLLKIYNDALPAEIQTGLTWYQTANRFARKVAVATNKDVATVAAVIARVSPQVSWSDNKAAAFEICSGAPGSASGRCYPDNVERALSIARENSHEAIAREVLPKKGYPRPKIAAFYSNISDPDIDGIVTIDTWAIRVWRGDVLASAQTVSPKHSAAIANDYRIAAKIVGTLAHEFQAIVWVAAHRLARQGAQRSLFDIGLTYKI